MKQVPKIINWEFINSTESGHLTMEEYLEACLAAGYSKEQAAKAAKDRGLARLRKGMPA